MAIVLLFALAVLAAFAAAAASKLLGCGLGAYSLGRRDAIGVSVGMIPRGEVGMIAVQIGGSLGSENPIIQFHSIYQSYGWLRSSHVV